MISVYLNLKKKRLEDDLHDLNNQKAIVLHGLNCLTESFNIKQEETTKLTYNKQRLEILIDGLTNNQECQRVVKIMKEDVRQILDDKIGILKAAMCSVLEALKEHPEKQILIYDSLDAPEYRTPFIPLGKDFQQYKQACLQNLLDLAEHVYDNLLYNLVSSSTIYSTSSSDL